MRSNKVLILLKITRQTLTRYVKDSKIQVKKLPNGYYEYNDDDVYKLLGQTTPRKAVIYCRVSTAKQKQDLQNQESLLRQFCASKGIVIGDSFLDIGSGINYDRNAFRRMLQCVIQNEIKVIYIAYKDRLSRLSYDMFQQMFAHFDCDLVVMNESEDKSSIEKEVFGEIISLLHCFSMKMYSARRKKKLELVAEDLKNELCN